MTGEVCPDKDTFVLKACLTINERFLRVPVPKDSTEDKTT